MRQFLLKLKTTAPLVLGAMLLLGITIGHGLQLGAEAEAAPGGRVDYFLKIDGVTGESNDAKHKGEIELQSYAWSKDDPGLTQTATTGSGGGGAGKVQLHDIYFTSQISKATPQLMEATASGKHFKEAVLTVRKSGKAGQEFMVVKLQDVLISSYRSSGEASSIPLDAFSLNFAKIEFSYIPQKADGTPDTPVVGSWDFRANKAE